MQRFFTLVLLALTSNLIHAQGFLSNSDGFISVRSGAFLSVEGDVYHSNNAFTDNSDTIYLTGDFINQSTGGVFTADPNGTVVFRGDDQRIGGSQVTEFQQLDFRGAGIKYADIDVHVNETVQLNDREVNVDTNSLHVLNTDLAAVLENGGFVSSLGAGGLERDMDSAASYVFPVGSSAGILRVRPAIIQPSTNAPHTYKVRMAGLDPNLENKDRDDRQILICYLNDQYYYRIFQTAGSDSADVIVSYDPMMDGDYNHLAQWKVAPEWRRTDSAIVSPGPGLSLLELSNWGDFSNPDFDLAYVVPEFVDLGPDKIIFKFDSVQLAASGGITYLWEPFEFLGCDDCPNPWAFPDSTTTYHVFVEDEIGCRDRDTIQVKVIQRGEADLGLFIPNGISPNGDGKNELWRLYGIDPSWVIDVVVVNRWGERVYENPNYSNDWGGTWKGKLLPEATYYYVMKVDIGNNQIYEYDGPLTIIY